MDTTLSTKRMYELKAGDRVGDCLVISTFSFYFTTMLYVIDDNDRHHIIDLPGDTQFKIEFD